MNFFAFLRPTHRFSPGFGADLGAGLLVFLIALPLCLGIAMASGFPPMAGILSAVVGGLLVSRINGSHLTIAGPAAGLVTVLYGAVQALGEGDPLVGYRCTLAAVLVAGLLQVLLGMARAGRLAAFFPAAIVHGMLAAIGIIIMVRQLHSLLGARPPADSLYSAIAEMPWSLLHFNPEVSLIGGLGLLILFGWPLLRDTRIGRVPAPLVVVASGWLLGQVLDLNQVYLYLVPEGTAGLAHPHDYGTESRFLTGIPDNFLDGLAFPDFSKVGSSAFWQAVLGLVLIGSLESLLVTATVDRLDPQHRQSDPNRDLTAIGAGNSVAGLIGGMPMVAEIVRSSANVDYGAKSGWSNFVHGAAMLGFVALFPRLIQQIPLASLAALLIYAGFRLASPRAFRQTWEVGADQLALLLVTVLGVLATDLLVGVGIGMLAKLLLHRWRGVRLANLFRLSYAIHQDVDGTYRVRLDGAAVFSNFMALKKALAALPSGASIVFDLSNAGLIDHTVMDYLDQTGHDHLRGGGRVEFRGLEAYRAASAHPLAARRRAGEES